MTNLQKKIKTYLDEATWNITSFLYQPIVPTVTYEYVINNDGSYSSNNMMIDDYVYYWIGDSKSGKEVKVKSVDVLRHEYKKLRAEMILMREG